MQPIARRLIVVSAVILCGAAVGVALGDFAARPGESRLTGVTDVVGRASDLVLPSEPAAAEPPLAVRAGPNSYHCEGCDAKLPGETALEESALADIAPLPPYQPEQVALPPPIPPPAPRVQVPAIILPGVGGGTARPTSPPSMPPAASAVTEGLPAIR